MMDRKRPEWERKGYVTDRKKPEWERRGYITENEIGRGTFGQVICIRKSDTGERYACKYCEGASAILLLRREASFLQSIAHPLFAQYVDYQEQENSAFLIMEYIGGISLLEKLKKGPMEMEEAVRIGLALAEGLAYLQERQNPILYRDLKPEHIMLAPGGEVRLLDLGCACPVREAASSRAGTREYAAPEQLLMNSKELQKAKTAPGLYSDVYAWGKVMHYMLTGDNPVKPPFRKPSIQAYNRQFPLRLSYLLMQCTQENPRFRPPDMRRVVMQLYLLETKKTRGGLFRRLADTFLFCKEMFFLPTSCEYLYEKNVCLEPENNLIS